MLEKVLAGVSLAFLTGFLAILVWFVPVPDLVIVTIVTLAMALFDFYREIFRNGGKSG